MPDASIRVPAHVRERLTRAAAAHGLTLRNYLIRLARHASLPANPVAVDVDAVLHDWNGYHPTTAEQRALDAELDRRLGR